MLTQDGMSAIDLGSAYGDTARRMARESGCKVTCIDISKMENKRNVELTSEADLGHLVSVKTASFTDTKVFC